MDIIFDIDGTLADCGHRLHHIKKEPKDWSSFYAETLADPRIPSVVEIAMTAHLSGCHKILFATGRSEICRPDTELWLSRNLIIQLDLVRPVLWMRGAEDRRPDYVVKSLMLEDMRARGFNPELVFEDRQSVVDMWRTEGLVCAQVAPGNF